MNELFNAEQAISFKPKSKFILVKKRTALERKKI